jgi:hypothetical protein
MHESVDFVGLDRATEIREGVRIPILVRAGGARGSFRFVEIYGAKMGQALRQSMPFNAN